MSLSLFMTRIKTLFGHTSALLLKKKKVTRKGHFARPAETDPYVLLVVQAKKCEQEVEETQWC